MPEERSLSIVLFSGTDDKLTSAATLIAGAVAMGTKVHVLVQFWALESFQADRIEKDHGAVAEAGAEGSAEIRKLREGGAHWSDTLRMAKDLGDLRIFACAQSMEMFSLAQNDLDPLIDGVEGAAAFMGDATGALLFI